MIQLDFKIGDKVKITENIYSVEGTLYKGSVVEIEEIGFPDKDLRVSDNVGRIWYLNFYDIEKNRDSFSSIHFIMSNNKCGRLNDGGGGKYRFVT